MALDREETFSLAAAGTCAVEHRQMLGVQPWRAFERHGAASIFVGSLDLALAEANLRQEIEIGLVDTLRLEAKGAGEEVLSERPLVEDEFDVKGRRNRFFDCRDLLSRETFGGERLVVDARRAGERAVAHRIFYDAGDRLLGIAELAQSRRHHAIDDLEIATASELLELHQSEVGLDAGGVAVHDEADRSGRRNHSRLGITETVFASKLDRLLPRVHGVRQQPRVWAGGMIE